MSCFLVQISTYLNQDTLDAKMKTWFFRNQTKLSEFMLKRRANISVWGMQTCFCNLQLHVCIGQTLLSKVTCIAFKLYTFDQFIHSFLGIEPMTQVLTFTAFHSRSKMLCLAKTTNIFQYVSEVSICLLKQCVNETSASSVCAS